ncbi:MAG: hypothetical protein K0R57_1827 [Paenibacillaceae bacterium]|nr:hypothetical protein [Paenibacillaceae bacterium]
MKYWRKSLITTVCAALILPTAASAASSADASAPSEGAAAGPKARIAEFRGQQSHPLDSFRRGAWNTVREADNLGVHKRTYLALLAEKYTPETATAWNAAFSERERLVNELKELKPAEEDRKTAAEERYALSQEWKSGSLTLEELKQKYGEMKDGWISLKALRQVEWKPLAEERAGLRQTLTAAVGSGDAAAVSTVLNSLLSQIEKENAALVLILAQLHQSDPYFNIELEQN